MFLHLVEQKIGSRHLVDKYHRLYVHMHIYMYMYTYMYIYMCVL